MKMMMLRMNRLYSKCPFGYMKSTMKMGMSSIRMRSRYESNMMPKEEEEDEEWILSPHAPQSTTPRINQGTRRLPMAKAFPGV